MPRNHRCNKRYFKRKLYDELGLESLQLRRWFQKVMLLLQILQTWISSVSRNSENITLFKTKHNVFKNSFFPSAVIEWNNLDLNIRNVRGFTAFKNNILNFIRPTPNNVFNCENHRGIKRVLAFVICVNINSSIVFKIH